MENKSLKTTEKHTWSKRYGDY